MDANLGVQVEILPSRLTVVAPRGMRLFDVLRDQGLVAGTCSGAGWCGRCRVRWLSPPPRPTETESASLACDEIADGWRLGCQQMLTVDARLWVSSGQVLVDAKACNRIRLQGGKRAVERVIVPTRPASDSRSRTLARRLSSHFAGPVRWSPAALADLTRLRQEPLSNVELTLYVADRNVLHVTRADKASTPYGLAIDLGTSVVGLYLVDFEGARIVAGQSFVNPQTVYGEDVLSRISYVQAEGERGRQILQRLLEQELDRAISRLTDVAGVDRYSIFHARVVGNPAMLHLFFGADPRSLGRAPFAPVFSGIVSCLAADVGMRLAEGSRVDSLPAISGFVGADAVAGALYAGFADSEETMLLVDVGTNAELILTHRRRLFACAAAAGPALEAGTIGCGLAAQPGAIDTVEFADRLRYTTIGGELPRGVCGSGLVDLLAVLLDLGVVREDGRIDTERARASGLAGDNPEEGIQITDGLNPLVLSQRDVRQLQLAIAALRSGIEALLAAANVSATAVDRVVVTGSCGARLDPRSMTRVGILPLPWTSRVTALENGAGLGAAQTLVDTQLVDQAIALATEAVSVQLAGSSAFAARFVQAMKFPSHTGASRRGSLETA
jgi:uncharacterized 2Fe-2S/4Fe-4S cluster protein (DUF4445 family)